MTLGQDQAKHARDIGVQQSRRHHRTQKHCQVENNFHNISHPIGRPTRSLSVFTHHYSRAFLLNSLLYIPVHTTHQTFIQRHLFTEPQLYQVKQVPREFDTRFLSFYTTCAIWCTCRSSNIRIVGFFNPNYSIKAVYQNKLPSPIVSCPSVLLCFTQRPLSFTFVGPNLEFLEKL